MSYIYFNALAKITLCPALRNLPVRCVELLQRTQQVRFTALLAARLAHNQISWSEKRAN